MHRAPSTAWFCQPLLHTFGLIKYRKIWGFCDKGRFAPHAPRCLHLLTPILCPGEENFFCKQLYEQRGGVPIRGRVASFDLMLVCTALLGISGHKFSFESLPDRRDTIGLRAPFVGFPARVASHQPRDSALPNPRAWPSRGACITLHQGACGARFQPSTTIDHQPLTTPLPLSKEKVTT